MISGRTFGIATTLCFGAAALSMMLGCERDAPTQVVTATAPEAALPAEEPVEEAAEQPAEEGAVGDEASSEALPADEEGDQKNEDAASSAKPTLGAPPVPETLSRGQLRQFGNAEMLRAFFESKPLEFLEFLTFMSVAEDEPLTPVEELEEPQGREVLLQTQGFGVMHSSASVPGWTATNSTLRDLLYVALPDLQGNHHAQLNLIFERHAGGPLFTDDGVLEPDALERLLEQVDVQPDDIFLGQRAGDIARKFRQPVVDYILVYNTMLAERSRDEMRRDFEAARAEHGADEDPHTYNMGMLNWYSSYSSEHFLEALREKGPQTEADFYDSEKIQLSHKYLERSQTPVGFWLRRIADGTDQMIARHLADHVQRFEIPIDVEVDRPQTDESPP